MSILRHLKNAPQFPCAFQTLVNHYHAEDPELRAFCEQHPLVCKPRDKGVIGKTLEHQLLGRSPNNDRMPDLGEEGDLKGTQAASRAGGGYRLLDRLTLTNVGKTQETMEKNVLVPLRDSPIYRKIRKGVLFVFLKSEADVMSRMVVAGFQYDLETLPVDMQVRMAADWARIQESVRSGNVSQKDQKTLHIHRHNESRAIGFTAKFVTELVCHYTGRTLHKKGNSWFFD